MITASLNYLAPQTAPLHTYAYDPPDGGPRFNGRLVAHAMPIGDARTLSDAPSLATTGFDLVDAPSGVRDWWEEDELHRHAYPEAETLVRNLTGARHALVFDHTLRRRAASRPPLDGLGGSFAAVREPVGRVHADYTPLSGPRRLRQVLAPRLGDAAAASLAEHGPFLIIGLWRPLNDEPLTDAPLAVADARSVRRDTLVPNDLVYHDRRGQTYAVVHDPAHRWYHVPLQRRDEVIAFMHYRSTSATDASTGASPHTAFEHPHTPSDAPPRQSLELRVLAWFD